MFKKCQSIVVGQTSSVPHIGVPSALTLCLFAPPFVCASRPAANTR